MIDKKWVKYGCRALILHLITFCSVQAQLPKFTFHDTPSNAPFACILQDQLGYMWFGGKDGLYRFNGVNWISFKENNQASSPVQCITQSSDTTLWIGYESGQINQLKEGKIFPFEPEEGTPKVPVQAIKEDLLGQIWIATYGEGLYCYTRNRLYNFNIDDGLGSDEIYDLLVLDSTAWIATDEGLYACSWQGNQKTIDHFGTQSGLTDPIVLSLARDTEKNIFIGTHDGGLFQLPKGKKTIHSLTSNPWQNGPITAIQPVNAHQIWIGTQQQGLFMLEHKTARAVFPNDKGNIQDFELDKEGNLWVSCEVYGLLSAFLELEFLPLNSGKIYALQAGQNGTLFYSNDQGLHIYDPASQKSKLLFPTSRSPVISILIDRQKRFWLGTFGDGLYCLDPEFRQIAHYQTQDGMSGNNVFSLIEQEDSIWCATLGGLCYIDLTNDLVRRIQPQEGIKCNYIYKIFEDRKAALWLGTDGNGLLQYTPQGFRVFLPNKTIFAIGEDHSGNIWASTDQGELFRYTEGKFEILYVDKSTTFKSIVGGAEHEIIGITNGKILQLDNKGKVIRTYDQVLGLEKMKPTLNTWTIDSQGMLWIGTNQGLIGLNKLAGSTAKRPQLHITYPRDFLEEGVLMKDITIPYNKNYLTFDYFGFWYQAPQILSYKHRLIGLDTAWVETHTPKAIYPHLAPGAYTFEVQMGIDGSFDSRIMRKVAFRIRPPFWQKSWFILLVMLTLAGVVFLIFRLYESGKLRQERRERERAEFQFEILRSQINPHFLFNSFNTLIDMIEQDEKEKATQFTEKLSDIFRTVLFYHKQATIPLGEELKIIKEYYQLQKFRFGEGLILNIHVDETKEGMHIPPLTLQLLLENAVKHNIVSLQKPLTIDIELDDKEPYLIIKNNLQKRKTRAKSTGIGLQNIIDRYRILTRKEVEIQVSSTQYLVRIPLIQHESL